MNIFKKILQKFKKENISEVLPENVEPPQPPQKPLPKRDKNGRFISSKS